MTRFGILHHLKRSLLHRFGSFPLVDEGRYEIGPVAGMPLTLDPTISVCPVDESGDSALDISRELTSSSRYFSTVQGASSAPAFLEDVFVVLASFLWTTVLDLYSPSDSLRRPS